MAMLPITSAVVALFALALIGMSFPVSLRRLKVGTMIGEGADDILRRRIRAQGNFTEYVPLGVVALGLVEAHGAGRWYVVGIGVSLVVGRALHAAGMYRPSDPLRGLGIMLTYLALVAVAIRLLWGVVV